MNVKKSKGNYFVDTDGNVVLDLNTSLALGYNYESFMWDRMVPGKYDRFL